MARLKSWFKRLSLILLLAIMVSAFTILTIGKAEQKAEIEVTEEASNIQSAKQIVLNTKKKDIPGLPAKRDIESQDSLVAENQNYALYLNNDKVIVKLLDKANGYVWSSGIDTDGLDELSPDWKSFSQSIVVAEYIDKYAPTTLIRSYPVTQDIRYTDNGFIVKVLFEKPQITVDVSVALNIDGITVEVPDESIKYLNKPEKIGLSLSSIYMMPFFGAVKSNEAAGYIFVPDGSGALIRFGAAKKYSIAFGSRVYGMDYGLKQEVSAPDSLVPGVKSKRVHIPVFGMSHGYQNNAFVAIIENGQEYADIIGNPAGVTVDYFWAASKFNYLEAYYQPTSTGIGFSLIPKEKNIVNAKVTYKFLNGQEANYVGMAKKYKQLLIDRGDLVKQTTGNGNIPVLLEAFMAEQSKGLFTNVTKPMTTISDLTRWVEELGDESIDNLLVSLKGYQKGGLSGNAVGSYKVERKIGSEKELESLYEQLKGRNSKLLLTMDYSLGYSHQSRNSNFIYNITRSLAQTYEKKLLFSKKMFMNTNSIMKMMNALNSLPDYKQNILMESTGYTLLSDYRSNKEQSRNEALNKITQAMEKAFSELNTLAIESPNEYAFKYAEYITNIPDNHSQFIYETDAVPFLQIVFSGYVDYFSPHLNFGSKQIDDALKLIDYNMYPSYLITEKPSSEFEGTNINDIYFSEYKSLKPYLVNNYKLINEVLSQVRGQSIVARSVVDDGISVTTYQDGTKIIVNYTNNHYDYEGKTVEAKSAIVIKG